MQVWLHLQRASSDFEVDPQIYTLILLDMDQFLICRASEIFSS
jgi:hypothetical protein